MKSTFNSLQQLKHTFCNATPLLHGFLPTPRLLVLVRHGLSERNHALANTLYFTDEELMESVGMIADQHVGLRPLGFEQGKKTGAYIRETFGVPDVCIHTGFKRTRQTTEALLSSYTEAEREQILIKTDTRLRERNSGYTHTMLQHEVEQAFPYSSKYWKSAGKLFAVPHGGESLITMGENRVWPALEDLDVYKVKFVLCVLHGRTIQTAHLKLSGMIDDIEKAEAWLEEGNTPSNCGISLYQFDPKQGKLTPTTYNQNVCNL
jgi:broad specificity phosphatase PhoE